MDEEFVAGLLHLISIESTFYIVFVYVVGLMIKLSYRLSKTLVSSGGHREL